MTLLNESKQFASSRIASRFSLKILPQILGIAVLSLAFPMAAKAESYTFKGGSDTTGAAGVYGMLGTPNAANIPGAREGAVAWKTPDGNKYLFGGYGVGETVGDGALNDLWFYNSQNNIWTWLAGSKLVNQSGNYGTINQYAGSNLPGSRSEAVGWVSPEGRLYLFGGQGYDSTGASGKLNDLWVFDPTLVQWKYIAGSTTVGSLGHYGSASDVANIPSARSGSVSWKTDNAVVYLFGGDGIGNTGTPGKLNDLWRYNIGTNQWSWLSGTNIVNTVGTYTGSPVPGARKNASAWVLSDGQFGLFGGEGYNATSDGMLNDVWKFNPTLNTWSWFGGSSSINSAGVYGTIGTPSTSNIPGARRGAATTIDSIGNLWMIGGYGYGASGVGVGYLSDLWVFDNVENQWYWAGGSNSIDQTGSYGVSSGVRPGGREKAILWTTGAEELTLFGGTGIAAALPAGKMNDVWSVNTPGFDLAITVAFDRASVPVSETVNAKITVQNQGSVNSGSSEVVIVLPGDVFYGNTIAFTPGGAGTISTFGYESRVQLNPIAPGQSVVLTVPVHALVKGALSVSAVVDSLGDTSETNNSFTKTIEVTSDAPSDLVGGALVSKAKLNQRKKGSETKIKLQSWMTSTVNADFPKTVSSIYIQDTPALPPNGTRLATTKWSKIKASSKPWKPAKVLKKNINVKAPGVAHGKYLILHLDSDSGAPETNEFNNYIVIGPIEL